VIRRCLALLAALALGGTLAACTSSGGKTGSGPTSSAASSSSASSTAPPVTQPKSVPASVPNKAGVITKRLVTVSSCKKVDGGWQASGSAKGANGKSAKYTVTVFFTTKQATVQAFGSTKVAVPSGQSKDWSVTSKFAAADGTQCVLRGAG
jgi:hypothetical protein